MSAATARRPAGIRPRTDRGPAPLAFAQERIWFLDQLLPGSTAYVLPLLFRLRGRLDQDALRRALREIVRRHEVLRSTFPSLDGRPVQVAGPVPDLELPVVDLTAAPDPEREAAAAEAIADDLRRPFDLATGPVMRATFLRVAEAEHRLLLVVHHLACDAWSEEVLTRELAALYEAFAGGLPSPLSEPAIQFADFAVWQREQLERPRLQTHLGRWAERLRGPVATVDLAAERPRPAVLTQRGAVHRHPLPEDVMEAAGELARRLQVTPYVLLLAAFTVLLHRCTGETDVVVGTTTAGRGRRELRDVVGFVANTLALRTDLSGAPTFREVVGRVRETVLDALDHAEVPFERVVEAARPDRRLSATPLFQVLFVVQDIAIPERRAGDVTIDVRTVDHHAAQFDLTLGVWGRTCCFEYNVDLFDADQVARLGVHFELLLRAALAEPDRAAGELPMLTAEERRRLLLEWNDTAHPYPDDRCLHDLIAEQARRAPERLAVVSDDLQLDYGELEARAGRLARLLVARGVGPETRVGICLERSVDMVVAMYAVLKAGGTYVPLATDTPPERLVFLLRLSEVALVLGQRALAEPLASAGVPVLRLDAASPDELEPPPALPRAVPDGAAYVMFTSGSTGVPKGVVVAHRSLCNLWAYLQSVFRLDGRDRMLHHLPFTFDMAAFGYLWPLVAGATVVVAAPGLEADPAGLADAMRRHGVTIVVVAPPLLDVLVEQPALAACDSLRCVIAGGDTLPATLRDRFRARLGAELHNAYGPTETTIGMTFWPCAPIPWQGSLPIGRPIWNVRTYVLDPRLEPVPVGVRGEICIGGIAVTRGYLGRADLTAERYLPDPHSPVPGARMYRSGDLGRWLPGGDLQCLGRVDDQVKLRGARIEPQEVAVRLGQHPDVREGYVCVREIRPGDERLVAYVVPRDGRTPQWREVRAFLAGWLPRHMVPAAMVVMEAIPLRPTGKVDRAMLPLPQAGAEPEVPGARPRTALERAIAAAWRDALQVERVGLRDNFFDLGGHSLLLIRVCDRLRAEVDPELSLLDLFRHPTVGGLAEHLAGRGQEPAEAPELARGREAGQRQRDAMRRAIAARRGQDGR